MTDSIITAERYHDFSYGHRVYNHESKCAHLHGHNGRIHFTITAENLDSVGRTMDFSEIKSILCMWIEDNWDHKFLVWSKDPWADTLKQLDPAGTVLVTFNPTAENMASYMLSHGNALLTEAGSNCKLTKVKIEETRKCCASIELK